MIRYATAILGLFPGIAWAADTIETENPVANGLTVTWTPAKLGKAACASTDGFDITVKRTNISTTGDNPQFVTWWPGGTGACSGTLESDSLLGTLDLDASDTFWLGSTWLDIPSDLNPSGTVPTLNEAIVLARESGACTGTGVAGTTVRLCFAIDLTNNNAIDTASGTMLADPFGWVQFVVDTKPPPPPESPTVTPLDGKLSVKITDGTSSDSTYEDDDVASYRVMIRKLPTDATEAAKLPAEWTASETTSATDTSNEVTIDADNGVEYQVAAYALDDVDNESPASTVVTAKPQAECDVAECYPTGLLEPGYCGAAQGSLWGIALVGLALGYAWRRARVRGAA